jgi:hypothetical protein
MDTGRAPRNSALALGRREDFVVTLALRNRVRSLLHIKKERGLPRRGRKPSIGDYIVCGNLRITVQAGFADELWAWLMEQGWRELTYRPERRNYRELPVSWVTRLIDATPEERPPLLGAATARASFRPSLGDPNVLPRYIDCR